MIRATLVLFLNISALPSHSLSIEMFFKPDEVDRVLQGDIYTSSRFGYKIKNTDRSNTNDKDRKGYFYYAVHAMKVRSGLIKTFGRLSPESFANRIRAMTVHIAAFFEMGWSQRRKVF